MAIVEVDLNLIIGVVVALVGALIFLFKLGWGFIEKEIISIKSDAIIEKKLCADNAKLQDQRYDIQNQRYDELQKSYADVRYKLGLLEGRAEGVHHAEIKVHDTP
jgi:hypothetical protein